MRRLWLYIRTWLRWNSCSKESAFYRIKVLFNIEKNEMFDLTFFLLDNDLLYTGALNELQIYLHWGEFMES